MTDKGSYLSDSVAILEEVSQIVTAMQKLGNSVNLDNVNIASFVLKRCEAITKIYQAREALWWQDLEQMEREHKQESLGYK